MKYISYVILFSFVFMNFANAVLSIKLHNDEIYYRSLTSKLRIEGSDGTTRDKAIKIFLPIDNTKNTDYIKFKPKTDLPQITDATLDLSIPFDFVNDDNAGAEKIYIAIENSDTNYTIIAAATDNFPGFTTNNLPDGTHTKQYMTLSLQDHICVSPFDVNCADLADVTPKPTSASRKFYVFVFSGIFSGSFDPSDDAYKNGLYFEFFLSNIFRDNSQIKLKIDKIDRGDESLYIDYSTEATDANMVELYVIKKSGISLTSVKYQNAVGAEVISEENEFPATAGASIRIGGLKNGTSYNLTVAFVDKYGFVSKLPASLIKIPEEIEEFIKSQQCYLLSAGFGREHYIIDYFKMIRDEYLSKISFGKKIISFYYSSAPQYTKQIYNSESLSLVVRGSAYVLYFFMNYMIHLLCIFLFLIIGIFLFKDKFLSKAQNIS